MKIIIFSGGYGTRIWPASRKSYPKQFYPLIKGKSFFEITVRRFRKRFKSSDIFISTEKSHLNFIRKQAPEIPRENIILEPERRDLLGAVGLVTAVIEKRFPGEVMFFSWSDHLIGKEEEFLDAVIAAGEYTRRTGRPVSVNEKPTFASVHNGWLEVGEKKDNQDGYPLYEIKKHTEKPNQKKAKEFFKSKKYLIHTGYGAWRSDMMLGYFKEFTPQVYKGLVKIMEAWGTQNQESTLKKEYHKFEKTSIEYELYEKLPRDLRLTIAISSEWEDAGTWQLFYKALFEKGDKSVIEGGAEVELVESEQNLVIAKKGKLVAIIGLNNLVVIDTDDALLISSMDKTDKVKELFKVLEKKKPKFVV